MVVMGVDLRSSSKNPSAVSVLNCGTEVTELEKADTDDDLLMMAERFRPASIAIGAPLGLPEGQCCLETACDCAPINPHRKGRQSELELAQMHISCFPTSKKSIIRALIYRSIRLAGQLRDLGFEVIEVYPHATKVILFGDAVPPKNSARSLVFMKERLPNLVRNLEPRLDSLNPNACDAIINGYTALLHRRNETDRLGNQQEGFLILPRLVPSRAYQAGQASVNARLVEADD